jgi:translation elongation factor EF-G
MYFKIAEFNDTFADIFLQSNTYAQIPIHDAIAGYLKLVFAYIFIILALKESTLARKLAPIACGSGLKSTQSVVPLLDMIINFLPSPVERNFDIPDNVHTCGLVFKVCS